VYYLVLVHLVRLNDFLPLSASLKYFIDCHVGCLLYLVLLIFQMNLEYFAIDSQVTIFFQIDHWLLIQSVAVIYMLEIHVSHELAHLVSYS
jgi:hypothetical protein